MPLKKSAGNMYPWVTHTHSFLGGECPHKCVYCYVDNPRFGRAERYTGAIRLIEAEFKVNYGTGKTIFIEHMNDLFSKEVPSEFIAKIMDHCKKWPENTYVFQTKNPARYMAGSFGTWPKNFILGTTIETNREMPGISEAPDPMSRIRAMSRLFNTIPKFITIEPVLDFDVDVFAAMIASVKPFFVNLGADSKDHNLPEPTVEKVMALVAKLDEYGIELREKHNLQRLKP